MRAVPQSPDQSYNETVREYFTNYYARSYLSHLMVYRDGIIQRLLVMPFVLFCWLYYLFVLFSWTPRICLFKRFRVAYEIEDFFFDITSVSC